MDKITKIEKSFRINENVDAKKRTEIISGNEIIFYYLASLVSDNLLIKLIESMTLVEEKDNVSILCAINIEEKTKTKDVVNSFYEGNTVIYFKSKNRFYVCESKSFPSRGITTPDVERSVRGSKDSFNENLIDNIALIRRRLKSEDIIFKNFVVSSESKMNVTLVYSKKTCPQFLIERLTKSIESLKIDSLIMAERSLQECLYKNKKNLLPLVRFTERPDVASINIMNGKAILLIDTSSNAIITPVSILDHLKHVEEYKQNRVVGTFTKILRLIGTLISIISVPLFILCTIDEGIDNGIFPNYKLENATPVLIQVMIITTFVEIIRISIVHTPNALISTISFLSAIILGDVAIELGLFSPEILLIVSLSAICNYATPSYELSLCNRIISYIIVLCTCLFQSVGFMLSILFFFLYQVSVSTFSVPFLYPFCPFDLKITDSLIRKPSFKKK